MKKIFCILSFSAFALTSCSDDSSSPADANTTSGGMLVKTISTGGGETYTTEFAYNGTKLTGFSDSEGGHSVVTYDGDFITSIAAYDSGNVKVAESVYHYNASGLMDVCTEDELVGDFQAHEKFVYTHNGDGTISVQHYSKGFDGAGEYEFLHDGVIYHNKATENVPSMGTGSPAYVDWHEFTYDTNKNPMMLITGFDKIAFSGDTNSKNYTNNETSKVHKNSNGLVQPQTTTTYEYNDALFPTSSTETEAGVSGDVTTTTYFYQ